MKTAIRSLMRRDADWVIALTAENEIETSPMDDARYAHMLAQAFRATTLPGAFLLAFDQDADYASPNFLWFRERYPRFAYVDRVVVNATLRGRGLARALYEDLFEKARAAGLPLVGCEVNVDQPNPASDAFHARLGFSEVGEALLANAKRVRYLVRLL